ncbi:MAG: CBS domain-containing protein [Candidatus Micrarchaeota archaeon]|nr:CBS domain-containing protein [Candidatus Micrarchaeota archaeon]
MELVTVKITDKIADVFNELLKKDAVVAVVDQKGKFLGVPDKKHLRILKQDKNAKVERILRTVTPVLESERDDLEKVLRSFIEYPKAVFIVNKNKKLVDFIPKKDVVGEFLDFVPNIRVDDIMQQGVYLVDENKTLQEAKAMMRAFQTDVLIVSDKKGQPLGMITYDDLIIAAALFDTKGRKDLVERKIPPDAKLRVKDIIYEPVITTKRSALLPKVVKKMVKEEDIAVVMDLKRPVGMFSIKDVAKVALEFVKAEDPSIEVLGLAEEDEIFLEDIKRELKRLKEKIGKIKRVDKVVLFLKQSKGAFRAKLTITGEEIIHIEEDGYDLGGLLKRLVKMATLKIKKLKPNKKRSK